MRIFHSTILPLLLPLSVSAQPPYTEKEVIGYAKALDVATLDPALPSQRLDAWLRSGAPRLNRVRWQMSPNCDRKPVTTNGPYSELPLCIKVYYQRGNVSGWGLIVVGTIGKGPSGPPHLESVDADPQGVPDPGAGDTYVSGVSIRLSDLPRLLDEASYIVENKQVIRYAKALDVATLDPILFPRRLDDWLHSGPAHSEKLAWEVRFNCDSRLETTAVPRNDSPLCVTAVFGQGDTRGWVTILIGTFSKGPSGPPRLISISVQAMSKDGAARQTSDKLSDLPQLLDKVSSAR